MADLGCQDTDWVGENNKEVLDAIPARWPQTNHFKHGQRKICLS